MSAAEDRSHISITVWIDSKSRQNKVHQCWERNGTKTSKKERHEDMETEGKGAVIQKGEGEKRLTYIKWVPTATLTGPF